MGKEELVKNLRENARKLRSQLPLGPSADPKIIRATETHQDVSLLRHFHTFADQPNNKTNILYENYRQPADGTVEFGPQLYVTDGDFIDDIRNIRTVAEIESVIHTRGMRDETKYILYHDAAGSFFTRADLNKRNESMDDKHYTPNTFIGKSQ